MRNKIIGYVSAEDPFRDKKAWSGTKYKIREALQNAGYEVVWISCKPSKICFIFLKILLHNLIFYLYQGLTLLLNEHLIFPKK